MPDGAVAHVYPAPAKATTFQRGYQQALADVAGLPSLKAIRELVAANLVDGAA